MLTEIPFLLKVLLFLCSSFLITYYLIPKIVWVAREKELVVKPDHRSSHHVVTPSFGGVAFFICFILCYSFLRSEYASIPSMFLIPGVTVLFIVGLKDDLVISSALGKLFGQVIAVSILFLNPSFWQLSFHGFLGIHELPVYLSVPFIYLFMIGFINAYNLIDGIDGLASIIGVVILGSLGAMFLQIGMEYFFLVCMLLIGSLLAFTRFNFSRSIRRKIFMGDTGSLFIGFLIGFLALKMLAMSPTEVLRLGILPENLPALLLIILSIPIFDTLRIMVSRKLSGQKIFLPDRNHVHHILIDLGYTHFKTSLMLSVANISLIAFAYWLSIHFSWPYLLGFILLHCGMAYSTFHYLKSKVRPLPLKRKKRKGRMSFLQHLF
ncbi:hypothetical protein P872_21495 [Rhodonellum psychrophilum GCM71 = DSM 17998]|uniref:Glycosyl transferase n=2 Tax=Rhodonellum TaxID=336827 RepID=U5BVQ3_9BACT|nr:MULTISPECIES: MraY family glycosyltransferase [Rhodonellum]ERM80681.1 hypothetical protein P872_21495 [Rhodonellum psychrophilum GCM71 = DSM 17998]SDZ06841.1 UDP-N-acetylmuramyl pentapeptide phosphotransferase/UDP-N-acetylglucosamine-1-phosphate transferase [Rhodonellum ikkaensis]